MVLYDGLISGVKKHFPGNAAQFFDFVP